MGLLLRDGIFLVRDLLSGRGGGGDEEGRAEGGAVGSVTGREVGF